MSIRRPLALPLGLLALALALTAVGLLDQVAGSTARQRIAARAGCVLDSHGRVTASLDEPLGGLRALTGDLGTVSVSARGVQRGGITSQVSATLHEVGSDGSYRAGTALATVDYGQLAGRLAAQSPAASTAPSTAATPTLSGDGSTLDAATTVGALGLPVTVRSTVTAQDGRVTVTPTDAVVLGRDLPVSALAGRASAGQLAPRTFTLPSLPTGVTLTGAVPEPDGLRLDFALADHPAHAAGAAGGAAGAACQGSA
ncbi:LmeA family phospholipid-binding protein [Kitasatospora mediocidica]|uniref:LmeA family phospholipid-binding protein n=1 Tax=Kitasatospora mediocidica TaxID=58352 RepID=UPI0005699B11|nr:LmeA family phospholipid-binding protein [Kitasatospora mediocidica]